MLFHKNPNQLEKVFLYVWGKEYLLHLKRLLILGRKRFRSSSPVIARLTLLLVLIILTTIGFCTICGSSSISSYFFIYYYIFLSAELRNLFLSSNFFRIFFAKQRTYARTQGHERKGEK